MLTFPEAITYTFSEIYSKTIIKFITEVYRNFLIRKGKCSHCEEIISFEIGIKCICKSNYYPYLIEICFHEECFENWKK